MQPQNKGPGMLWGQSYVLPMTWGGGGIWGAPFGRHAALRLFHFIKCDAIEDNMCVFLSKHFLLKPIQFEHKLFIDVPGKMSSIL